MPLLEFVDDEFLAEFTAMREKVDRLQRKLDSFNGPGISNGPDSISFYPIPPEQTDTPLDPPLRYLKVTAYDPVNTPEIVKGNPCNSSGVVFDSKTTLTVAVQDGARSVPLYLPIGSAVCPYIPYPGGTQVTAGGASVPCNGMLVGLPAESPLFLVKLTQTGGSAGSASTLCSFTYSVYGGTSLTTSDQLLLTGASPAYSGARVFKMTASAATAGIAAVTPTAGYILLVAFEVAAGTKSC